MQVKTKKIIVISVVVLGALIIAGSVILGQKSQPTVNLDGFAQCLKDKGAVLYGAFWCPHCQAQKKLFGDAQKNLPYVECSTPDGKGQLDICTQNKIDGYPTWTFSDGTRQSGELSLEALAGKTGCGLPQ